MARRYVNIKKKETNKITYKETYKSKHNRVLEQFQGKHNKL